MVGFVPFSVLVPQSVESLGKKVSEEAALGMRSDRRGPCNLHSLHANDKEHVLLLTMNDLTDHLITIFKQFVLAFFRFQSLFRNARVHVGRY